LIRDTFGGPRFELRVAFDAARQRLLEVEGKLVENLAQLDGHVIVADEDRLHHPGLDDAALRQVPVASQQHAVLGGRFSNQLGVSYLRVIRGVVAERAQPAGKPADVAVSQESGLHRSNLRIGGMVSRDELMEKLRAEARDCYSWSNGPGDRYAQHSHAYEKVLYCVDGSITFVLEDEGTRLELKAGDRMILQPGTVHSAIVGSGGCTCIEGRR
jgi:uncharacterized cupin superfamily protein